MEVSRDSLGFPGVPWGSLGLPRAPGEPRGTLGCPILNFSPFSLLADLLIGRSHIMSVLNKWGLQKY